MPVSFINALQKCETKSLSWSVMSLSGNPFSQNHLSKNIVANSSAVMLVLHGASWISAFSLSVMVTMVLKSLSLGSGPMKSIATESNRLSGTGRGCRGPPGFEVVFLFYWHLVHEKDVCVDEVFPHVRPVKIGLECIV